MHALLHCWLWLNWASEKRRDDVQSKWIVLLRIAFNLLLKEEISYEYLPTTRLTIYFPFSRSYTVFNWGFLHFLKYNVTKINKMKMPRTIIEIDKSSPNMNANQLEDSSFRSELLCKMNAPSAQSRGMFSTWLAYPILLNVAFQLEWI